MKDCHFSVSPVNCSDSIQISYSAVALIAYNLNNLFFAFVFLLFVFFSGGGGGLTSWSTICQSFWDGATTFWVFTSTLETLKWLTQGHFTAVVGF